MTPKRCAQLLVRLGITLSFGWLVVASGAPQLEDLAISTWQGRVVAFHLVARDADLDTSTPGAHPLVFSVLDGPMHGVLAGDLNAVLYRPEQEAVVSLTYTPADGFVGTERLRFAVSDPLGETATADVDIEVRPRDALGMLSGDLALSLTMDPQTPAWTAFSMDLGGTYRIGVSTLTARAEWKRPFAGVDMALEDLRFGGTCIVAGTGMLSMVADFDPDVAPIPEFESLRLEVSLGHDGVQLGGVVFVTPSQTDSYAVLTAIGTTGCGPKAGSVSATVRLGSGTGCGGILGSATFSARLPWVSCDLVTAASIAFSCGSFDGLVLEVDGLRLAGFLEGQLSVDVSVAYAVDAKRVMLAASWSSDRLDCVRLLADLAGSGALFGGFDVYGLMAEHRFGNGIGFESRSSLHPTDHAINTRVTGLSDYWEVGTLFGGFDLCCGLRLNWKIATYFGVTQSRLFDWGMTRAAVSFARAANLEIEALCILRSGDLGDPTAEWAFRLKTHW